MIIIGSNGLLGSYLVAEAKKQSEKVIGIDISNDINGLKNFYKMDITSDINSLMTVFKDNNDDYIVNCAAFTDVDGSENPLNYQKVINSNSVLPLYIAVAMDRVSPNKTLIHISTDYVSVPSGFYAYTKDLAENILLSNYRKLSIIIGRTTILYGNKKGFIPWVINSLKEGKKIKVVTDQSGSPTYAGELARQIFFLKNNKLKPSEVISLCGNESFIRYDLACRIAKHFKLDSNLIIPITTKELNQLAERPVNDDLLGGKHFLIDNDFIFNTFDQCLNELSME